MAQYNSPIGFNVGGPGTPGWATGPQVIDTDMPLLLARGRIDKDLQRDAIGGRLAETNINAGVTRHGIDTGAATDRFRIEQDTLTDRRGQDQNFALGNRQADIAAEGNQLDFRARMAPIEWSKERWGQVFPWIQGMVGNQQNERVGGANRPLPGVTVGGVYSDQQTQQNVNAARAGIDQSAASQGARAAAKLAGQGFGSRSPLLAALQQQIQGRAMAAGADAERGIRHDAATANADQRFKGESLAQKQWADFEDADIRRRQAVTNQTSALLSALAAFA